MPSKAFKSIRGEEIAEEMNQRRRSRNLIIHGVSEDVSDAKKWSSDLVDDLHVHVTIKWVSRIGAKIKGKTRPLLLGLENEEEKEKMIGNLKALKGIEKYKGYQHHGRSYSRTKKHCQEIVFRSKDTGE